MISCVRTRRDRISVPVGPALDSTQMAGPVQVQIFSINCHIIDSYNYEVPVANCVRIRMGRLIVPMARVYIKVTQHAA